MAEKSKQQDAFVNEQTQLSELCQLPIQKYQQDLQRNNQEIKEDNRLYGANVTIFPRCPFVPQFEDLYNFPLSKDSNVTAMFLTCCQRHMYLTENLASFSRLNSYPLKQILVVQDGKSNELLLNILKRFPQVRLITTQEKVGQIMAIDIGYKQITTPYVFFSEDDWLMIRPNVIQMNIQLLEKYPKILQVWNNYHQWVGYDNKTRIVERNNKWGGFSFHPSVNRMDLYRQLPNGYAGLTKNISYGTGSGQPPELEIISYYRPNYYAYKAYQNYFQHLGWFNPLPRYIE